MVRLAPSWVKVVLKRLQPSVPDTVPSAPNWRVTVVSATAGLPLSEVSTQLVPARSKVAGATTSGAVVGMTSGATSVGAVAGAQAATTSKTIRRRESLEMVCTVVCSFLYAVFLLLASSAPYATRTSSAMSARSDRPRKKVTAKLRLSSQTTTHIIPCVARMFKKAGLPCRGIPPDRQRLTTASPVSIGKASPPGQAGRGRRCDRS